MDGEIVVTMDIQNPCPQKYRMHEKNIGRLVRVDELSDQQTDEYFHQFEQPYTQEELNAWKAPELPAQPMLVNGPTSARLEGQLEGALIRINTVPFLQPLGSTAADVRPVCCQSQFLQKCYRKYSKKRTPREPTRGCTH